MNNYSNAFAEVYTILSYLKDDDYVKIPREIINIIYRNQNFNYNYKFDINLDWQNQNMLVETKAILFNLFRDYLATDLQKEKILNMKNKRRIQAELEKMKQNKYVDIFQKKEINYTEQKGGLAIKKEKVSIIKKIFNNIKKFLNI